MQGNLLQRGPGERVAVPGPGSGRRYVARRGAAGLRVLVHHPYGRVARLAPAPERAAGAGEPALAPDAFPGPAEAAEAIARDVLHRPPDPGLRVDLARLLEPPAPRVEIDERTVRALAGRSARPTRGPA